MRRELLTGAEPGLAALRFNLLPNVSFQADLDRVDTVDGGDRVFSGHLNGLVESHFLLLVHGEEVIADFYASPWEHYQLRRSSEGVQEIRRVDLRGTAACGGGEPRPARRPAVPRAQGTNSPATAAPDTEDDPDRFDVLIAYTPAARLQAGGVYSIEALAGYAIQTLNNANSYSGIKTHARLVHTMEVNYTEIGDDLTEDLRRLEDPADGFLDEVHAARDFYQADLVSLFIAGPPKNATGRFIVGRATFAVDLGADGQPVGVPEGGFSVVSTYDPATTFTHEVGHNFGCQHDRENVIVNGVNTGPGIFPFSYGWRFLGTNGQQFHDVMAYDPGTGINYFSNPEVIFLGTPTGVPDYADNARTINATAPLIANLRRVAACDHHRARIPRLGRFEDPNPFHHHSLR